MFKIINKQILAKNIKRVDITAPGLAAKAQPGQFVSISPEEGDKRIPLTIVDTDLRKESITVLVHEVGEVSRKLAAMSLKDPVFSVLGPLGRPSTIEKKGRVVCIATGIGAAQILPIARALKNAGNKVIGIIGAKTKRELLLEPQMRLACSKLMIATNDGSYERRALATELFGALMEKDTIDAVYAVGSAEMMQTVSQWTAPAAIPTYVYLHPVMVDCMGMCGSCRVKVGAEILLACMDGPEFNGHLVDFEEYAVRLNAFKKEIWHNQKSTPSSDTSESKTFKRFLSGILKG